MYKMTPLGNYQLTTVRGRYQIEPTVFISSNWKPLCEIADLSPIPTLKVFAGLEPNAISKDDTAAMFIEPSSGDVILNKTDLDIDCTRMTLSSLSPIGMLWGMPAGMIRACLSRAGRLEVSQRLGIVVARRAGWPKQLLQEYERIAGLDKGSEGYKRRCDILLIQAGVQFYMQNLKIDDEVNCPRLKEIIWSKRDGVNLELFAVKRQ